MHQIVKIIVVLQLLQCGLAYKPKYKLVDLTYALGPDTIVFPILSPFIFTKKVVNSRDGKFFAYNEFTAPEHIGTHMDAPFHFCATCLKIDEIPVEKFVANGFVIDISKQCSKDRNYALTVDDVKEYFKKVDINKYQKEKYNILLLRTGWGKFWNDRTAFLGTSESDASKLSFPGFGVEAAKYIVSLNKFVGVGIDTISNDPGKEQEFPAHVVFSTAGVYGIENVANLEQLPPAGFTIYAFPSKLEHGTGSSTRVVARIPSTKYNL